jgi:hypothetical protein
MHERKLPLLATAILIGVLIGASAYASDPIAPFVGEYQGHSIAKYRDSRAHPRRWNPGRHKPADLLT